MRKAIPPDEIAARVSDREGRCRANTSRGGLCKRRARHGGYCDEHAELASAQPSPSAIAERIRRLDLSTSEGRAEALDHAANLAIAGVLDPQTVQAIVACVRQASKQGPTKQRTVPRVVFAVARTRDEAERIMESKAEQEAAS